MKNTKEISTTDAMSKWIEYLGSAFMRLGFFEFDSTEDKDVREQVAKARESIAKAMYHLQQIEGVQEVPEPDYDELERLAIDGNAGGR